MKIYIIRHGETFFNERGLLQGWTDNDLNASGVMLAEETGKALKGVRFDAVFSSPLIRARHTAELVMRESGNTCPTFTDDRIKEIKIGDYEGKPYRLPENNGDMAFMKAYFSNPITAPAFPNGEHVNDVMVRTQSFLNELAEKENEYENVFVSTHGCAMRCMLNFLYADPSDFWHGRVPLNCAVNIVDVSGGVIRIAEEDVIYYDPSKCIDRYSISK